MKCKAWDRVAKEKGYSYGICEDCFNAHYVSVNLGASMKICTACKLKKEYSEYPSQGKKGRRGICKECYAGLQKIRMKHRKTYAKNRNNTDE